MDLMKPFSYRIMYRCTPMLYNEPLIVSKVRHDLLLYTPGAVPDGQPLEVSESISNNPYYHPEKSHHGFVLVLFPYILKSPIFLQPKPP